MTTALITRTDPHRPDHRLRAHLGRTGDGEFSFLPDGTGTNIRWTYEFKPLRGRRWILAGPFTPLWRGYMRRALERMVAVVEAPAIMEA